MNGWRIRRIVSIWRMAFFWHLNPNVYCKTNFHASRNFWGIFVFALCYNGYQRGDVCMKHIDFCKYMFTFPIYNKAFSAQLQVTIRTRWKDWEKIDDLVKFLRKDFELPWNFPNLKPWLCKLSFWHSFWNQYSLSPVERSLNRTLWHADLTDI